MVGTPDVPDDAIETNTGYFWLKDRIVHIYNKSTNRHTLPEALSNIEASRKVAAGVSRPLLIDMTNIKTMERATREAYAAAGQPEYVTAVALVTRSTVSRLVGNFFIGFNHPAVPTRLFNSPAAAMAWLRKFLL